MHVHNISFEGTVSQIFVLLFTFYFMTNVFIRKICSRIKQNKLTRTYIKILRHSSLNSNAVNEYQNC